MADVREEDLFAGSSMSFGDHLEELRTCLFRAVAGLAVCMVVGFCVGKYVVAIIKAPLEKGLANYYQDGAIAEYAKFAQERKQQGLPAPYTLGQVEHLVNDEYMLFTIYKVHRSELRAALGLDPGTAAPASSRVVSEPFESLLVWRPMSDDERISVKGLSAQEPFMIWLKGSLLAGVLLASPWIFYQIWTFVGAGLYPHEKRFVHLYLPFSIVLFLSGAALCFFGVFHFVLKFLLEYNRSLGITPEPRMQEWLGFALLLPIGFGISFQLPLVMLFLNRIGIFTIEAYWSKWRLSVLVIFVIAMILTPADPYSMLAMAVPLTLLYFGGILLCQYMRPPKSLLDQ